LEIINSSLPSCCWFIHRLHIPARWWHHFRFPVTRYTTAAFHHICFRLH